MRHYFFTADGDDYFELIRNIRRNGDEFEEQYGEDWQCDDNWQEALPELACLVKEPDEIFTYSASVRDAYEELGLYALGGPDG